MGMNYRPLGRSGVRVSEVGFGAWGIGGKAYGAADRAESLNALARAEELGCNLVDTAFVYGDSELVVGEFLKGRRDKWLVATKYSKQPGGIEATLEQQLRRLGTDHVDLYQIHWAPNRSETTLYEDLYRVRKAGKARLVGVSLYSIADIDFVLRETDIDAFQVPCSLLDPDPYLAKLEMIRESGVGVLVRSTLKEGFLTGKYPRTATFADPRDQRHEWSPERIAATVDAAECFRFLEKEVGSMTVGAACYPLAFPETSTVLLGTRTTAEAEVNFGLVSGARLSSDALARVRSVQRRLRVFSWRGRLRDRLGHLVRR